MYTLKLNRTVLLWDVRDVSEKENKSCKSFRVNLDGDSADLICWSPDSRAFVVHLTNENACQVHKVEKKDGGGFVATPTKLFANINDCDITTIAVAIAPDGKFILTAGEDCFLTLWDLKGPNEITRIDTGLKSITNAMISPCGQFIAVCGTDCTVWSVNKKNIGQVKKTFDLKDVGYLAFDNNGTKLCTISNTCSANGYTWKLYDIPAEIHARVPILQTSGFVPAPSGGLPPKIAMSPQGDTMVIGTSDAIVFYKIYRPNEPAEMHRTVTIGNGSGVSQMLFDPQGKYLFVTCADRHIKVFTNGTKLACELDLAEAKLKEPQTSATKERLTLLVKECKMKLKELN